LKESLEIQKFSRLFEKVAEHLKKLLKIRNISGEVRCAPSTGEFSRTV